TARDFPEALVASRWTFRVGGAADEAVKAAEKALDLSGGGQLYIAALGAAYAAAGREQEARAVLDRLNQMMDQGYVSPYQRALIHLHLGERERALDLLQEAHR